jgi:IS30 family transposase
MKTKQHLTREQRYQIEALLQAQKTQKEIAGILGKDKSVISRE